MKDYQIVKYNGKKYCVCRYTKEDGTNRLFVIDEEDLQKILDVNHSWYEINEYIGYTEMIDRVNLQYYLHNLIMNKSHGKNKKYTAEHINKNRHDNRKKNLRLIPKNENQRVRERRVTLPEKCGIDKKDLPKNVYYCKPSGDHDEYFSFEFKYDEEKIILKSSKSKKDTLKKKLNEIKKKILDLAKKIPEKIEGRGITENFTDSQLKLMKDFNAIIKLSTYKCKNDNLMKIPKKWVMTLDESDDDGNDSNNNDDRNNNDDDSNNDDEIKKIPHVKSINKIRIENRRLSGRKLPKNCGVTQEMLPLHCNYLVANDKRGDGFVVDAKHEYSMGKKIETSRKKSISTLEKFNELKKILVDLKKSFEKTNSKKYSGLKTQKKVSNKIKKTNSKKYSGSKTQKKVNNKIKKTNNIVEI